jgi:fructose-1,6-bisphosphatase/inositol monophosphatase family enzyme
MGNQLTVEICDLAKGVALEAGELIVSAWHQEKHIECKDGSGTDLVTSTDKQVEQMIFKRLKARFPEYEYTA